MFFEFLFGILACVDLYEKSILGDFTILEAKLLPRQLVVGKY